MFNWKEATPEKYEWVEKFKDIFIQQKRDLLGDVFCLNDFGLHNGQSVNEYAEYEFHEFSLKANGFGLNMDASIKCYDIGNGYVYFALGKKEDRALFETMFKWDENTKKVKGNQFSFKIEPKMQFIKNIKTDKIEQNLRRINVKSVNKELTVKAIINEETSEDNYFIRSNNEDIFGGEFFSLVYTRPEEDASTYWERISILTNKGLKKFTILMRGEDHPLFVRDCFPRLSDDRKSINWDGSLFPVIIDVMTKNGESFSYKYPKEKELKFESEIERVCLTDTLSFDWILKN